LWFIILSLSFRNITLYVERYNWTHIQINDHLLLLLLLLLFLYINNIMHPYLTKD